MPLTCQKFWCRCTNLTSASAWLQSLTDPMLMQKISSYVQYIFKFWQIEIRYTRLIFSLLHIYFWTTLSRKQSIICGPFYLSVASALVGVSWYNNKSAKEIKQSTSALAKKKLDHCQNGFPDRRGIGFHLPGCIRESSTVYRQKGVIKQINYPSSAHSKLCKKIPDWVGWSGLVKRSREFWSNYGCSIGVCLLFSICTQALCTFLIV